MKKFQLLKLLNDLSIKHLIKQMLYDDDDDDDDDDHDDDDVKFFREFLYR